MTEKKELPLGQLADGRYRVCVQLKAREADARNHWKLSAVFERLQDAAGLQCDGLGCGREALMREYGYCYVIVRMLISMDIYPQSGDTVYLETWPDVKMRLVFTRYFRILNAAGGEIGRAVSHWVLFDTKTRTAVRPQSCPILKTPDTAALEPPMLMPKGKEAPEDGTDTVMTERMPLYGDFDYNGHVNNARYVAWVEDAILSENAGEIQRLDIRYEHELSEEALRARPASERTIRIRTGWNAEKCGFTVSGQCADGTECFFCQGQIK